MMNFLKFLFKSSITIGKEVCVKQQTQIIDKANEQIENNKEMLRKPLKDER